jgi:hypothetical protein
MEAKIEFTYKSKYYYANIEMDINKQGDFEFEIKSIYDKENGAIVNFSKQKTKEINEVIFTILQNNELEYLEKIVIYEESLYLDDKSTQYFDTKYNSCLDNYIKDNSNF